ncbi:alpha/beta hydrolase [Nocardioides sp. URHA0020]|uniref:alpha/beta hydrolase n=1 Tax=Nocardioides sp. URHA0020 TaxID=1380392 RepID=UPI00055B473B|nr:alpha/beta hydrolase [Nocardioides sp. URHA0020]
MTQTTERIEQADTDYHPPAGLRTRGTVVVVPGRGEARAAYRRFATRVAADAYRVQVVDPPSIDPDDLAATLAALASALGDAVESAASLDGLARPLVVVASDSGAAAVAALLARGDRLSSWWPDAVVLAGLPGRAAVAAGSAWDDELEVRTSCAVHRGVLSEHAERGALSTPLPDALLDAAYAGSLDLPQLILVGDADPLADRPALARTAAALSQARLSVVRGAHHDVLNDQQHRSVAAEVVTFLEALRQELVPVIAVESSAW